MKREPAADTTPVTGSEARPESGTTLMSAPPPAQRWEVEMDDRVTRAERGLEAIEARLRRVESELPMRGDARHGEASEKLPVRWGTLLWLVALVLVAIAWRLTR